MSDTAPKEVWGSHEHKLDEKGRVSVPAVFRTALGIQTNDVMYVTRAIDEACLLLFWAKAWDGFLEAVEELEDEETVDLVDEIIRGYHHSTKVDKLGRIQLPAYLRKFAGLDGTCLILGQGKLIKIWSEGHAEDSHAPARLPEGAMRKVGRLLKRSPGR